MKVLLRVAARAGAGRRMVRLGLSAVRDLPRTRFGRVSAPLEGGGRYIEARTSLSPMGLLAHLKRIEAASAGRRARRRLPPLRLDILYYGRRRLRSPFLEVPPPHAPPRRAVPGLLSRRRVP